MCRLSFAAAISVLMAVASEAGGVDQNPIASDAEIQSRIERAVTIGIDSKVPLWEQAAAIAKELGDIARKKPEDLVQQVLHYVVNLAPESEARFDAAMQLPFYLRIPETDIAYAVVPYIDSENPRLEDTVSIFMRNIEDHKSPVCAPDYSNYTVVIRRYKEEQKAPPLQLIRYMFAHDPSEALREIVAHDLLSPPPADRKQYARFLWPDHVVKNAVRQRQFLAGFAQRKEAAPESLVAMESLFRKEANVQLESLAASQEWWVRLYVAEILRQHPELRQPEIVARLVNDEHPLVREAMGKERE